MPYRTKTHSWTVSLIHRLLLGKILIYLLIIQAVELSAKPTVMQQLLKICIIMQKRFIVVLNSRFVQVTNASTEIDLESVKNKSMPYRTKTHSWTVSLIHRLLLGKILIYLLIIQAVELSAKPTVMQQLLKICIIMQKRFIVVLNSRFVQVTNASTEIDLESVKNKSMPYRTKTHSWTVSLIHRLLLGKIPKYLLIIQAVELSAKPIVMQQFLKCIIIGLLRKNVSQWC